MIQSLFELKKLKICYLISNKSPIISHDSTIHQNQNPSILPHSPFGAWKFWWMEFKSFYECALRCEIFVPCLSRIAMYGSTRERAAKKMLVKFNIAQYVFFLDPLPDIVLLTHSHTDFHSFRSTFFALFFALSFIFRDIHFWVQPQNAEIITSLPCF